ncbi:hypothetical protein ACFSTI_25075 [Rhizorhabdus histidinilytica]|uniref:Uncharacterized protein n=1 Tax=Rhizorhabdus histidinilytica TaxID=439228 RepID=A0A1T5A8H8_9SPHN|nr:hypothetical protein [Rhizorhabdus histidinilytica]SKB31027.1 hypothetical protein SAMN06295920_101683 [Rhizorhabdus histidinilytica]
MGDPDFRQSAEAERAAIVAWLEQRAEAALNRAPDPEQPGTEHLSNAWSAGAYNALYLAAAKISRGDHLKEKQG